MLLLLLYAVVTLKHLRVMGEDTPVLGFLQAEPTMMAWASKHKPRGSLGRCWNGGEGGGDMRHQCQHPGMSERVLACQSRSQEIQRCSPSSPQSSRMTSEQAFGKPLGTGGSCRLQRLIVYVSLGVRCLISHYDHQGARSVDTNKQFNWLSVQLTRLPKHKHQMFFEMLGHTSDWNPLNLSMTQFPISSTEMLQLTPL